MRPVMKFLELFLKRANPAVLSPFFFLFLCLFFFLRLLLYGMRQRHVLANDGCVEVEGGKCGKMEYIAAGDFSVSPGPGSRVCGRAVERVWERTSPPSSLALLRSASVIVLRTVYSDSNKNSICWKAVSKHWKRAALENPT